MVLKQCRRASRKLYRHDRHGLVEVTIFDVKSDRQLIEFRRHQCAHYCLGKLYRMPHHWKRRAEEAAEDRRALQEAKEARNAAQAAKEWEEYLRERK